MAIILPDTFADKYTGAGVGAHKANVKIQFEYDLLSGDVLYLHLREGKENDQGHGSKCIDFLEEGDVHIGELGYFYLEDFREISEKEAYFLMECILSNHKRVIIHKLSPSCYYNNLPSNQIKGLLTLLSQFKTDMIIYSIT